MKHCVEKYVIKYADGRGYVNWDDNGGPVCSGYPYSVDCISKARMYDKRDQALHAMSTMVGVRVVGVRVEECAC